MLVLLLRPWLTARIIKTATETMAAGRAAEKRTVAEIITTTTLATSLIEVPRTPAKIQTENVAVLTFPAGITIVRLQFVLSANPINNTTTNHPLGVAGEVREEEEAVTSLKKPATLPSTTGGNLDTRITVAAEQIIMSKFSIITVSLLIIVHLIIPHNRSSS